MKIIDPHLHLFNLTDGDYHWLKLENAPFWPNKKAIFNSYTEADLALNSPLSLERFIHIEAGFNNENPITELQWLEQHCTLPFKAIGYLDITRKDFSELFIEMQKLACFAGIRDLLDDDAVGMLSAKYSLNNLALMAEHNAIFEAQLDISKPDDVEMLNQVMIQIPTLNVIVNHAGSPKLLNKEQSQEQDWKAGVAKLALQPHCYIKCSGWEMRDDNWKVLDIIPQINHIMACFGVDRVMLASNFPVCGLTKSYQQVWQDYVEGLGHIYTQEQLLALCHDNAKRIYQL